MDASNAPNNIKATPKTISQYTDTAYNSQDFPPQKPRREQGFLRKMITHGKKFDFFHSTDVVTTYAINEVPPSVMAAYEASDKGIYWDEKTYTHEGLVFWGRVYDFMVSFAKACLMFILPLFYAVILVLWKIGGEAWNDGWSDVFYGLTLFFTLPALLIYGHFKLLEAGHSYLAPFLKYQRVFELNRTTGMVTLYKKGQPLFTHPFIEFDCVLMSAPTHQGFLNYSLVLIHRYNNYSVGVPLGARLGPNEKVVEYLRFWNMIQRYMDISQPLPDIMVLEGAREYDPTSIAYDKEHPRNPRYWRDMTHEEFGEELTKVYQHSLENDCVGKIIDIFHVPKPPAQKHKKNRKK